MLVGKGRGELGGQRGAVRWGVKTSQHQHSEEEIQHGRRRSLSSSEETSGEEKEKLRRKLQNWRRFHAVQQKQCGRKTVDKLSELQRPPEIFPQEVFSRNLFLCTTVLKKNKSFCTELWASIHPIMFISLQCAVKPFLRVTWPHPAVQRLLYPARDESPNAAGGPTQTDVYQLQLWGWRRVGEFRGRPTSIICWSIFKAFPVVFLLWLCRF